MTGLERLAAGRWETRETAEATTETPTPERTRKPRARRAKRDPEAAKAAMERLMGGRWEA